MNSERRSRSSSRWVALGPTLLAAVRDATHPAWRASALGVDRFWGDAGYAIGALIGGITAALARLDAAVSVAAVLTAASGVLA
jgi:hypothetical protein